MLLCNINSITVQVSKKRNKNLVPKIINTKNSIGIDNIIRETILVKIKHL